MVPMDPVSAFFYLGTALLSLGSSQLRQRKLQEGRERELAAQTPILREKQMKLRFGQAQIGYLTNLFLEQDQAEPRIYTLPISREQPGIVDRINLWIDQALRT